MRMAFVGRYERMSAQRAYELGMISEVVDPPERLRDAAQELAEKIAQNSPAAMAATKRALWGALELGLTDACKAGAQRARVDVGPPRPGGRPARVRREARAATGSRSTRSRDRDRRSPIGTAVVAYIEPHAGAGARVQPLVRARPLLRGGDGRARALFAGARWVATRACKARAAAGATWFGDPARGSYLATVLGARRHAGGMGRVGRRADGAAATPPDRLFAGRDHMHTGVYRFVQDVPAQAHARSAGDRDSTTASPASIAVAVRRATARRDWPPRSSSDDVPLASPRSLRSARSSRRPSRAAHELVLGFSPRRSARVWARAVGPLLDGAMSGSRARSSARSPAPTPTSTICDS